MITPYLSREQSFRELRKRALSGDADAQFELGWRYYSGRGVPTDYITAARWWETAAEQGHSQARFDLLVMFRRNNEGKLTPVMPTRHQAANRDPHV